MNTINPYLHFNGSCEEAFNFYKSTFGGEFSYLGRYSEMPENPDSPISEEEKEKIMHMSLPISEHSMLMGSDASDAFGGAVSQGSNFSVSVSPSSEKETDRLFAGLSEGGQVKMPPAKTFWGSYFCMFTDKFGIHWMIDYMAEHKD